VRAGESGLVENRVDNTSFSVNNEYPFTQNGLEIINIVMDMTRWAL
jgi:hypothetical protein